MDPLSVTVSVASFLTNCLTTVKALGSLSSKYHHAVDTISSMVYETTILGAHLAHVQQLLLINMPGLHDQGPSGKDLRRTFDLALTACLVTFSCLEEEVRQLADKSRDGSEWRDNKAKRVFREHVMDEFLGQIRDEQSTMALLVQTLQMQSLSASNHFVSENRGLLIETISRSRALHDTAFPNLKVPDSIFEGSVSFLDGTSTIASAQFDFDDDVINSMVYRRVMARVQRQHSLRGKMKTPAEQKHPYEQSDSFDGSDTASGQGEDLAVRGSSRSGMRSPTMETVREEQEGPDSPNRSMKRRSLQMNPLSAPQGSRQVAATSRTDIIPADTAASSNGLKIDPSSFVGMKHSEMSFLSPDTTSELTGQVVNFSRKPPLADMGSAVHTPSSFRTDSISEFYDDSSSSVLPVDENKAAQAIPITKVGPLATRRVDTYAQEVNLQRGAMPFKAAKRLGVDERSRLAHIDESSSSGHERPESSASGGSGSSRDKSKKKSPPQRSLDDLTRGRSLDWSQPWSITWKLTPEEIRKPPSGYSIGLQELWWKLLQLEEHYQQSLELLHHLITSDHMTLPTCGITPVAVRKMQLSHDKYLRQPLRLAMGVGPWTFDYPSIVKAYHGAHSQLVPLYERYSWDLPLVTFQVAASSAPASSASRDLLLSIGPGLPTRYTCLRSPLTHVCATFDVLQALHDGMYKGGPHSVPNFAQIISPVREQLRSLIASCNRNVLLRWDDLRRSNLFGDSASREIAVVTKELIFPPSQRRNIALLNLSSPTRAVISRADLHWKAKPTDSWSRCHAILLNNYLILASTSDSKGLRQHQIFNLISLGSIATTTMSTEPTSDKPSGKKSKAGKPLYYLFVRTPEFEHILGFATMVHCLEWHEHLDVALRGEMLDMPTGISS